MSARAQVVVVSVVAMLAGVAIPALAAPPKPTVVVYSGPDRFTQSPDAAFGFTVDAKGKFRVTCSIDSVERPGCAVNEKSGTGTFVQNGLAEGPHTAAVTASDKNGKKIGTGSYSWTIDRTPPEVAFGLDQNDPYDYVFKSSENVVLPYEITDLGGFDEAATQCAIDDIPVSCGESVLYSASQSLSDGDHTASVIATDYAGNRTEASFTFHIVTPASLSFTFEEGAAESAQRGHVDFVFADGEFPTFVSVKCSLYGSDGLLPVEWCNAADGAEFRESLVARPGFYNLSVTMADGDGNEASAQLDFVVPEGPRLTFDDDYAFTAQRGHIDWTFYTFDPDANVAGLYCSVEGPSGPVEVYGCDAEEGVRFDQTVPGAYTLHLFATSKGGFASEYWLQFDVEDGLVLHFLPDSAFTAYYGDVGWEYASLDDFTGVDCTLSGPNGTFSIFHCVETGTSFQPPSPGAYTLTVTSHGAGSADRVDQFDFVIQEGIALLFSEDAAKTAKAGFVSWRYVKDDIDSVLCTIEGPYGTEEYPYCGIPDDRGYGLQFDASVFGDYTLTVTSTDRWGVQSVDVLTFEVAPGPDLRFAPDAADTAWKGYIDWSFLDPDAVDELQCAVARRDSGGYGVTSCDLTGVEFTIPEGDFVRILVRAVDREGNVSMFELELERPAP